MYTSAKVKVLIPPRLGRLARIYVSTFPLRGAPLNRLRYICTQPEHDSSANPFLWKDDEFGSVGTLELFLVSCDERRRCLSAACRMSALRRSLMSASILEPVFESHRVILDPLTHSSANEPVEVKARPFDAVPVAGSSHFWASENLLVSTVPM